MRRNRRFSADALRDARLVAGYSRAELGERVGVSAGDGEGLGDRGPGTEGLHPATAGARAGPGLRRPRAARARRRRRTCGGCGNRSGGPRREAAERLGVDPSTLKRVEAGEELPPDPRRMARVYGVTAAELAAVVRGTG